VDERVRVRVRRDGEVALADMLADPRKRLMRRCRRSCGENVGTPAARQARAIAVRNLSAPKPWKTRRSATRPSRATSAVTASKRTGGTGTHLARRVFATAAETRQWPRGSSTSPQVSCSSSPTRIPVASRTSRGSLYAGAKQAVNGLDVLGCWRLNLRPLLARQLHPDAIARRIRCDARMVEDHR
jgi:hypothetical protein